MLLAYKILVFVFSGGAIFLFFYWIFSKEKEKTSLEKEDFLVKLFKTLLPKKFIEKEKGEIEALIKAAGETKKAEDIIAQRFVLLIFLFLIGTFIFKNIFIGIFAGILGYILPVITLKGKVKKRKDAIFSDLPNLLDLLTLLVEGGMDFSMALAKIIERSESSPLVEEFKKFLQDLRLGKTRVEALRELDRRVEQEDLSEVTTGLIQATIMGSSLGPSLRDQSDMMRTRRFLKAEQKAQAATIKILFPIVLFIMPSVFIVIFGPVVMQLLSSGVF